MNLLHANVCGFLMTEIVLQLLCPLLMSLMLFIDTDRCYTRVALLQSKLDSQSVARRVVFIGGLPNDATEGDVIQLGLPFGRMINLLLIKKKGQVQ